MSWKYERFIYRGRTAVKIALHGKTMRVYFDLDIAELDTKYNLTSDTSKAHLTTPVMLKVKGQGGLKHAIELAELTFKNLGAIQKEVDTIDYRLPYLDRDTLIKKELVKSGK